MPGGTGKKRSSLVRQVGHWRYSKDILHKSLLETSASALRLPSRWLGIWLATGNWSINPGDGTPTHCCCESLTGETAVCLREDRDDRDQVHVTDIEAVSVYMTAYDGVDVQLHSFWTSAPDWGQWSASSSRHSTTSNWRSVISFKLPPFHPLQLEVSGQLQAPAIPLLPIAH